MYSSLPPPTPLQIRPNCQEVVLTLERQPLVRGRCECIHSSITKNVKCFGHIREGDLCWEWPLSESTVKTNLFCNNIHWYILLQFNASRIVLWINPCNINGCTAISMSDQFLNRHVRCIISDIFSGGCVYFLFSRKKDSVIQALLLHNNFAGTECAFSVQQVLSILSLSLISAG